LKAIAAVSAHQRWQEILGQGEHRALIRRGQAMDEMP